MPSTVTKRVRIYIDGGVRHHHLPSQRQGWYALVIDGEQVVRPLGNVTNNQAEYHALLQALRLAIARHAPHVEILSDSHLLVNQVNGRYKVKNRNIRPLYAQALALRRQLPNCTIRWLPRGRNRAGRLLETTT